MEQVKIDRRTGSTLLTMDEIKKRLKEHYLQLKREHGWSEDEMALNIKSNNNQSRNIKKGNKGNNCGKYGHKKADCWDLKNKKEKHQENVRCYKCKKLGYYANECRNEKNSSWDDKHDTFAMTCYENSEEEKYENGEEENNQQSKNPDVDERKVDPLRARNTEEPQGTPLRKSYISNVFMTGITSEWVMSMIENNMETPRVPRSVRAWIES